MSNINHPTHYNMGKIEVIDAIESWDFGEGFCRGNAIKYIARAGRKNSETEIDDLKKALWYIQREIARLGGEEEKTGAIEAEWLLYKGREGATCSYCKYTYKDVYDVENYDYYCRHCGAKMVRMKAVKEL